MQDGVRHVPAHACCLVTCARTTRRGLFSCFAFSMSKLRHVVSSQVLSLRNNRFSGRADWLALCEHLRVLDLGVSWAERLAQISPPALLSCTTGCGITTGAMRGGECLGVFVPEPGACACARFLVYRCLQSCAAYEQADLNTSHASPRCLHCFMHFLNVPSCFWWCGCLGKSLQWTPAATCPIHWQHHGACWPSQHASAGRLVWVQQHLEWHVDVAVGGQCLHVHHTRDLLPHGELHCHTSFPCSN
jgi:hypothetical protein